MAVIGAAREGIDLDIHRLAGPDIGELRFLIVGDHIERARRHDRHQLSAGLNILADAQRAVADRAVDGCGNGRIGEVQFGLMLDGLVMGERRSCLSKLGIQELDLFDGGI